MKDFAFSTIVKDSDKTYESLEDLQFYHEKGYIPYKFSDESELTEKEKSYKQIKVGGQRYFLQPPCFSFEVCDFCKNLGYAETYNTSKDVNEIQRCDECFADKKPWSIETDADASNKKLKNRKEV